MTSRDALRALLEAWDLGVSMKFLDAVKQARIVLAQPDGWQDIESTPKDRTIWLGNASNIRIGIWADGEAHEVHGSVGGGWLDMWAVESDEGVLSLRFKPTHWQPLPPAPNGE